MPGAVRVRFSPSPTGELHVGTARTALMNWLCARHSDGDFVLRIEDTDRARSEDRFERAIIEDLAWLGLAWDEGPDVGGPHAPYRQSERLELYREMARRLVDGCRAYSCFCSQEELDAARHQAAEEGRLALYPGTCRGLSVDECSDRREQGRPEAIRFAVEPGATSFDDLVRGRVEFDHGEFDDFVIMKAHGTPSYNFAAAVDDSGMAITHVMRGEDHLTNTARQLMLYQALALEPPEFGHLPMILGAGGEKLSKRHGATSIADYRRAGYPADALVNYMALLGWSHPEGLDVFGLEEAAARFTIERVSPRPSMFDSDRLDWLSGRHIRERSDERLAELIAPLLRAKGGFDRVLGDRRRLTAFAGAVRDRLVTLSDAAEVGAGLADGITLDGDARDAVREFGQAGLDALDFALAACRTMKMSEAETVLGEVKRRMENMASTTVMHGIRAAMTGATSGPRLADVLVVLGPDESRLRVAAARNCIC